MTLIDTNNDGRTSEDEFTEFLFIIKALSPWPGITDIKIVSIARKSMEMFDADKDNKISQKEFLSAVDIICGIKEPIEIANS